MTGKAFRRIGESAAGRRHRGPPADGRRPFRSPSRSGRYIIADGGAGSSGLPAFFSGVRIIK